MLFTLIYLVLMINDVSKPLFNFESDNALKQWIIVNDGVMGGLSKSQLTWHEDGYAIFSGEVSIENNGGFASTRCRPQDFNLNDNVKGIRIHVKGDGNTYQFRIHTDQLFDGAAYKYLFETNGEWQTIDIPFDQCKATFRGRIIPNAPRITPDVVQQVGFLIAEKQEGPFSIKVKSIEVF